MLDMLTGEDNHGTAHWLMSISFSGAVADLHQLRIRPTDCSGTTQPGDLACWLQWSYG